MKYNEAFLKLKKEIKKLSEHDRGFYTSFWLGYVHGICDYEKYGTLTEEEVIKLENLILEVKNVSI